MALARGPSITPERTPTTHKMPQKSQRILIMEKDVNQLVQEAQKVMQESAITQYQVLLYLLVRKSRELRDALRKAEGLKYAELQILEAPVRSQGHFGC